MNSGMNISGPNNDEYETPEWLFKALDSEFKFTWDAAATLANRLCRCWSNEIENTIFGAEERVFCNPPYSKLDLFIKKAITSGCLWVMLLPNRTDTDWFRCLVECSRVEFRFFRKRVRFYLNGKEAESPRFGTIIAIIRPKV